MATQTQAKPAAPAGAATSTDADRIKQLEAELRKARAQLAAPPEEKPRPPRETHVVFLANGDSFRTASPVMTKHHVEGLGLVEVTAVYEISGEED